MRLSQVTRRRGISRTEVGVVVVVGLLVLGLGLIFLLRGREGSDRVQCEQNLKTIGEAVQEFHEVHKALPASCIDKKYATWAVQIAPYLNSPEGGALKQWNLSLPYADQPEELRTKLLKVYFCPARDRSVRVSDADKASAGALGDYACSVGDNAAGHAWDSPDADGAIIPAKSVQAEGNKILHWQSQVTLAELGKLRGQSNTILVGEKHVPWDQRGEAAAGDGPLYSGDHPANFSRIGGPGFGLAKDATSPFNRNFGSDHAGMCQFLMADVTVRATANDISEHVLGELTNRFP